MLGAGGGFASSTTRPAGAAGVVVVRPREKNLLFHDGERRVHAALGLRHNDGDVAEIAERTLEAAMTERDIWGFRDVAAGRATRW